MSDSDEVALGVDVDVDSSFHFDKQSEDTVPEDNNDVNETQIFPYESLMRHQIYSKVVNTLLVLHELYRLSFPSFVAVIPGGSE